MLDVFSKKSSIEAEDLLFTPQENPTMKKIPWSRKELPR